jgi:hypothetical protein
MTKLAADFKWGGRTMEALSGNLEPSLEKLEPFLIRKMPISA